MEFTVTEKSIKSLLNDKKQNEEIIRFLNQIIDEEIEKDSPDCDLIDECIDAIDEIQTEENSQPALRLVLTKKQVMKYCRRHTQNNNAVKSVVAAALVLIMGGTAVFNASPALAETVKSFFETIVSTLQELSAETKSDEDSDISSIYASLDKNSNLIITDIDDIDEAKLTVTAVYSDGTERNVPISKCKISKTLEHTDEGSYVLVAISYDGCACSIAFEVRG